MSVRYPLKIDQADGTLKVMSDSDLETISLQLRRFYAWHLYASPSITTAFGAITLSKAQSFVPGVIASLDNFTTEFRSSPGYTSYNSRSVSKIMQKDDHWQPAKRVTLYDPYDGQDEVSPTPDAPTESAWLSNLSRDTTWYAHQLHATNNVNLRPDEDFLRTFSYLVSKGGNDIGPEGDTQNIIDTIIKHSVNEMIDGDEIGSYRVGTSSPGAGWLLGDMPYGYFFRDSISTVNSALASSLSARSYTNYYLYLKTGTGYEKTFNYNSGSLYNRARNHLMYSNYKGSMQSGSASIAPDEDFFIEGTYTGTFYVRASNTSGTTIGWSTDNSSYTNVSVTGDTTPYFDLSKTVMPNEDNSTTPGGPQIRTPKIYPTGSSADGYIRIYRGIAPEMVIGRVPHASSSGHGMGLGDDNNLYNTSARYKFEYEPAVREGYHPIISQLDAIRGTTTEHEPIETGRHLRLGLYAYVLLPILLGYPVVHPKYSVNSDAEATTSTFKRRRRGTITETRKTSSSTNLQEKDNTYYHIRFGSGSATAHSTVYLNIFGDIR